jgi:hypothetical protein
MELPPRFTICPLATFLPPRRPPAIFSGKTHEYRMRNEMRATTRAHGATARRMRRETGAEGIT